VAESDKQTRVRVISSVRNAKACRKRQCDGTWEGHRLQDHVTDRPIENTRVQKRHGNEQNTGHANDTADKRRETLNMAHAPL
jgi:hypothetical protein